MEASPIDFLYNFKLTEFTVYDGDTVKAHLLDLGLTEFKQDVSCRLYGIDTPELRTKNLLEKKAGYALRDHIAKICDKAEMVWVKSYKQKGKYPRLIVALMADEVCLNEYMIEKNFAKPYFGGTKQDWADEELNYIINQLEETT